jgi:hypothetical protein
MIGWAVRRRPGSTFLQMLGKKIGEGVKGSLRETGVDCRNAAANSVGCQQKA